MTRLEQRRIKKRMYSWWMVIILAAIAYIFLVNTYDVYIKYKESKSNILGLEEKYEESLKRQGELEDNISWLSSDRGVEEEIREKFNVVKDGEEVVVIVGNNGVTEIEDVEESGFFTDIWESFKEIFR
ncbi:MAG: septum formation initiator family protein [Candidatus Pacebacteria bacterium]|nr:septum formation initiator family protein [Candidatus Paceibacterota bacterium]